MDTEWILHVRFSGKPYELKAVLEYHSSQIMRIRVHGNKTTLLLENNYPTLAAANSKKGIQWKVREGGLKQTPDTARLLMDIFNYLEAHIKNDFTS